MKKVENRCPSTSVWAVCPRWHLNCSFSISSTVGNGAGSRLQVFAREMAVLTFAPLYWKVQVLSLILGQDSCSGTVPRAQTWERARFGDWFPYFDCPAEGRCFIQPTFNSGAFPRSWSWSIRPGTARWEAHSLANQHGKRDILDPFPEFHDAHAPPRSPFFTKRNLFHFI